jgi:hypothetical protein
MKKNNKIINNINSFRFRPSKKGTKKFFNISEDEGKLEEMKMIDLKIENEKLNKKHGKIMKKFIEKIKNEEKNIKENSKKLSISLHLIKKMCKKDSNENTIKTRNKTEINLRRETISERNENKKQKLKKNQIMVGNYNFLGKSKYSLPKVNQIIFGSIKNSKDDFEILQLNLQNEVNRQIQKRGFSKKLRLNGREIIDKLKIKSQK